ncbi:MAG TPA: DUF4870 domain-containing protein [Xanthomonadaceae bacterium]|jgi:hypothetical protein
MSTPDPASPESAPEPAPATPAVSGAPPGISADERQWAMLAHLSALLGYMLTVHVTGGAGGFIGPLVVWAIKKDTMPFVDQQGKEALNFSITICIMFMLLFWFGIPFSIVTLGLGLLVVLPAFAIVALYALVFTIIASIKANEGVAYRYPVALRLIK